jgi:hypothetical protein
MDMAPDSARPHWPSDRMASRRRQRRRRSRLDRSSSASARHPVAAPARDSSCVPSHPGEGPWQEHARFGPATVEELSQIPGAREALANYIGILQEWSARAEKHGAAP